MEKQVNEAQIITDKEKSPAPAEPVSTTRDPYSNPDAKNKDYTYTW